MCSICGIYAPRGIGTKDPDALGRMSHAMLSRGPDSHGVFSSPHTLLAHNRLTVVDPIGGKQPMTLQDGAHQYTIVYNGELYNTKELQRELSRLGFSCKTHSDTEALLLSYIAFGRECLSHLNGIFAFCIYDHAKDCLFCARDPLGVKPFFFAKRGEVFLFASEVKGILQYDDAPPVLDTEGLWQLLYLSPVTLPGSGLFRGISSLLPGEAMCVTGDTLQRWRYFSLEAMPFHESDEEAVAHVRYLVTDAIERQTISDVPLATLLSGGLDSSIVSAVVSRVYQERGDTLSTYSFEYEDNDYAPTLFQPQKDDEFAREMAAHIHSHHTVLVAGTQDVADRLLPATTARDFPGQADIDSSLHYFSECIKERHTVCLSGECADEIFGGYPWFYRPEMVHRDFFPWLHDPMARIRLFDPNKVHAAEGFDALSRHYQQVVRDTSVLEEDSPEDRLARVATKLSVDYFMASLLERKDRMSMAHGLEVRVPFSDARILSYVYNVPWRIKFRGGVEKALLRDAMASYLPPSILHRKKSPYPKTHNPAYERIVREKLLCRLKKSTSPLASLLRPDAIDSLIQEESTTWLGQLMAKPQLYAWLLQLDYWLEHYRVVPRF